jgi:hypothetical protein
VQVLHRNAARGLSPSGDRGIAAPRLEIARNPVNPLGRTAFAFRIVIAVAAFTLAAKLQLLPFANPISMPLRRPNTVPRE